MTLFTIATGYVTGSARGALLTAGTIAGALIISFAIGPIRRGLQIREAALLPRFVTSRVDRKNPTLEQQLVATQPDSKEQFTISESGLWLLDSFATIEVDRPQRDVQS